MSEPTDKELIAAVLNGDESSFEPLVARYQPRVFATARRYARREDEVADVVAFLATRGSYVNGTVLHVNGGMFGG